MLMTDVMMMRKKNFLLLLGLAGILLILRYVFRDKLPLTFSLQRVARNHLNNNLLATSHFDVKSGIVTTDLKLVHPVKSSNRLGVAPDRPRERDKDTILVYAEDDVCLVWKQAFPSHDIIVVGATITQERNNPCEYAEQFEDVMDQFISSSKTVMKQVYIAHEDTTAIACVRGLLQHQTKNSRYKIHYQPDSKEFLYKSSSHFGCGGIPLTQSHSPYKLCDDSDKPKIVLSTLRDDARMCDRVYPPMVLEQGLYSIPKMQCSSFPKSAFWALPFLGRSSEPSELVLSMMTENLLWRTGLRTEVRAPVDQTSSFNVSSEDLMRKVADVLSLPCSDPSFVNCSRRLSEALVTNGLLDDVSTQYMERWVTAIQETSYKLPSLVPSSHEPKCSKNTLNSYISKEDELENVPLNIAQRRKLQTKTCNESGGTHNFRDPWLAYNDMLLIVTYNVDKHYDTIPYFEMLYRSFFPHILYCGPGAPDNKDEALRDVSFSFISFADTPVSLKSTQGALHYECFMQATGMGYNVAGYMETSDDILLNPHRFRHYNTSRAWYWQLNNAVRVHTYNHTACDDVSCRVDDRNGKFWHKFRGAVSGAVTELNGLQSAAAQSCNKNRARLYGGPDWHIRIISDTYYVPARYAEDVVSLFGVFLRNKVYLEIAVPTVLHCLIPQSDFEPVYMFLHNLEKTINDAYSHEVLAPSNPDLVVLSLLDRKIIKSPTPRKAIWAYVTPPYMRGAAIFHPHKLGHVAEGTERDVKFFCDLIGFFGDQDGHAEKYLS